MTSTALSGEEFDEDPERAKALTVQGPVFVTEKGKPVYVLLGIEEYRRLAPKRRTVIEALSMPGLSDINLDRDRPRFDQLARPADLD